MEELHRRLHALGAAAADARASPRCAETVTLVEGLPERVLRTQDGERRLTDLRHVAQLLHEAATAEQPASTALTAWLRRRIADAERRHRRRGAQPPAGVRRRGRPGAHHPPQQGPRVPDRVLPVPVGARRTSRASRSRSSSTTRRAATRGSSTSGWAAPDFADHRRQHEAEQRGEDLRLAYVALTRAQHQAVVWWAGSWDSRNSRARAAAVRAATPTARCRRAARDAVRRRGDARASRSSPREAPGCISVEHAAPAPQARGRAAARPRPSSSPRAFDRGWTGAGGGRPTATSPPARTRRGWPASPRSTSSPTRATPRARRRSPRTAPTRTRCAPSRRCSPDMPFGAHVGTFVHGVFEATDFAARRPRRRAGRADRRGAGAAGGRRRRPGDVVAGLGAAIETPLGPLLGGAAAARRRARRPARRADFELPLAGGDDPDRRARRWRRSPPCCASTCPPTIRSPATRSASTTRRCAASVRGYLTGSIDLVVRRRGDRASPSSTTRRTGSARPASRSPRGTTARRRWRPRCERSHYALQALLYTVALHRYLRWRLPGYDPDRNLAGVLYLFLRGMIGPDTPVVDGTPCGVFAWRPPAALVTR